LVGTTSILFNLPPIFIFILFKLLSYVLFYFTIRIFSTSLPFLIPSIFSVLYLKIKLIFSIYSISLLLFKYDISYLYLLYLGNLKSFLDILYEFKLFIILFVV